MCAVNRAFLSVSKESPQNTSRSGHSGIQPLSLLAEVGTRLAPTHVCQQMTNIFADNWWDRGGPASLQQDKAEGRKTTGLAGQGLAFPLPSGVHYVAQG